MSIALDREAEIPLLFGGRITGQKSLAAEEKSVVTLIDVPGAGYLVGCILQVTNHSDGWWGEGDPIIRFDSTDRPAWRGTGTDDYFGFAWCSKTEFPHPLRGQIYAGPDGASMCRYHLLDMLPFNNGARLDFELHGTGSGLLDYSALVLWYSRTDSMND